MGKKESPILLDLGRHEHASAGMWVYGKGVAAALLETSLDVEVSYQQGGDPDWRPEIRPERWKDKGVSLPGRRINLFLDPYRKVNGYALIHGTANTVPLRGEGKRVVTVHDLFQAYPVNPPLSVYEKIRVAFYKRYFKKLFQSVDYVLCDIVAVRKEIVDRYQPDCSVEVLPPGLGKVYLEAPMPLSIRRNYYLMFASSDRRKNINSALKAFCAAEKNVQSVIVVASNAQVRERILHDLPPALSGSNLVEVKVGVPLSDMPSLYQNAAGLIFPSLAEGFGYPLYEALSQGTPVVFSNGQLSDEMAAAYPDFCFAANPQSVESITQCIVSLESTQRSPERMNHVAEFVRTRYTFSRCAERLQQIYYELTTER